MKKIIERIQDLGSEQNLSMLLGVLVVILIGNLIVNYFKTLNKNGQTSSTSTITEDLSSAKPGNNYEIQPGDTLWSISEKTYNDGYNWLEVYRANAEILGKNPDVIVEGTKISLPVVAGEAIVPLTQPTAYSVEKGDGLWNIAVKICNNGYLWPKIAKDNNLANPNQIEIGQKITINCY